MRAVVPRSKGPPPFGGPWRLEEEEAGGAVGPAVRGTEPSTTHAEPLKDEKEMF